MSNELEVFVSDYPVGLLSEDIETGLIDFRYLPDVPDQLSVSLLMPASAPAEEYQRGAPTLSDIPARRHRAGSHSSPLRQAYRR